MEIKVRLIDLVVSQQALLALEAQPLPVRVSYGLKKLLRVVGGEVEAYEAARIALCQRSGTFDEATNKFQIAPDKQEEFQREIIELQTTEPTISGEQIKVEDLNGAQLSAADLQTLEWLIVE